MNWHNPQTSKEERIRWLKENNQLWTGKDLDDPVLMMGLARTMRENGLYAPKTNVQEISYRLRPLILEAKKYARQSSQDSSQGSNDAQVKLQKA